MSLKLAVRPFKWGIDQTFILTQPTATLGWLAMLRVSRLMHTTVMYPLLKYTHGHNIPHRWFSEKYFNSFDSLPIRIEKTNDILFESPCKTLKESGIKMEKAPPTVWQNSF